MAVACGSRHTLCLSDDGSVYGIGKNDHGQLGIKDTEIEKRPRKIEALKRIVGVSCGFDNFSVCVDEDGSVWSFGNNKSGQLGLDSTLPIKEKPKQVKNLPPIQSVHCGGNFTLCLAKDSSVWGFGSNSSGQLGLGHKTNAFAPIQLTIQNVKQIACGGSFSLFQQINGNIYGCGNNTFGQLGLGNKENQVTPQLIPNLPKIQDFSCGYRFSIFLDTEGNLYSVGSNGFGALGSAGLHSKEERCEISIIGGLPKISKISCGACSTICIAVDGSCWSFGSIGDNMETQLRKITDVPKISIISTGGRHALLKDINGNIWVAGNNEFGQLGIGDSASRVSFTKLPENCNTIIGNTHNNNSTGNNWKLIAEAMKWESDDFLKCKKIEELMDKNPFQIPPNSLIWCELQNFFTNKLNLSVQYIQNIENTKIEREKNILNLRKEISDLENKLEILKSNLYKEENETINVSTEDMEKSIQNLDDIYKKSIQMKENNDKLNDKLYCLLEEKKLNDFSEDEMEFVLWKMNLYNYFDLFKQNHIDGEILCMLDEIMMIDMGMAYRDICSLLYYRELMITPGFFKTLKFDDHEEPDCCICTHNTPVKTLHLLKEYEIPLSDSLILDGEWTCTQLIFVSKFDELNVTSFKDKIKIKQIFNEWKASHNEHLQSISQLK